MQEYSFESIFERLLNHAARYFPELDRREGSLIYTALAPAAVELNKMYTALNVALNMSFADTASREFLIRRAKERDMRPHPATAAVLEAEVIPNDVSVPIGTRFRGGDVVYAVSEILGEGRVALTAETVGQVGNTMRGTLVPLSSVENLQGLELRALLVPGREEETTERFRERVLESFRHLSFGGNLADYREKVMEMPGVGDMKLFPAHQGPGTVKVVIIGADFQVPSASLLTSVLELLDPPEESGLGVGLAPIGHQVTVDGASDRQVDVGIRLVLHPAADRGRVQTQAEEAVRAYFHELARTWAREESLIVRLSQIETRLLDIDGVLDVEDGILEGERRNLSLTTLEIPTLRSLEVRV